MSRAQPHALTIFSNRSLRLRRPLDLVDDQALVGSDGEVGPVKAPVAVQGLPQPRRTDCVAGELGLEAELALAQHPVCSVAALELDPNVAAGEPVVDLADPDRRGPEAEAGVGDPVAWSR